MLTGTVGASKSADICLKLSRNSIASSGEMDLGLDFATESVLDVLDIDEILGPSRLFLKLN